MPKFNKTVEELETHFDKWLYVLRNLNRLERIPDKLREQIFTKVFESAEIARFNPEQIRSYEDSLKYYRDLKSTLDTARDEGYEEGLQEGKKEIARALIVKGFPVAEISVITGLSEQQINELR